MRYRELAVLAKTKPDVTILGSREHRSAAKSALALRADIMDIISTLGSRQNDYCLAGGERNAGERRERHGHNPEEAIVRAVNDTRDNDTVAAIVGAAIGTLHGRAKLPARWVEGLLGCTAEHDNGRVF